MIQLKIAHFQEQGQYLIVIPLDSSFHDKTASQREATLNALRASVLAAKLEGTVAVVWRSGHNRYFMAPEQWHDTLRRMPWHGIISRLNKTLDCKLLTHKRQEHAFLDHSHP